jgi:hypothetical protein
VELNSTGLWTQQELADLKSGVDYNRPVTEIAQTLQREPNEVAAKLEELGLYKSVTPFRRLRPKRKKNDRALGT